MKMSVMVVATALSGMPVQAMDLGLAVAGVATFLGLASKKGAPAPVRVGREGAAPVVVEAPLTPRSTIKRQITVTREEAAKKVAELEAQLKELQKQIDAQETTARERAELKKRKSRLEALHAKLATVDSDTLERVEAVLAPSRRERSSETEESKEAPVVPAGMVAERRPIFESAAQSAAATSSTFAPVATLKVTQD